MSSMSTLSDDSQHSFEDADRWHYAPVPTWIHDLGLTATALELYERLLAMTKTSHRGLRMLTLDQMRFLLTKPKKKPISKTAVKDAIASLKKVGLLEETRTGTEGKAATHHYTVHTQPDGEHRGWQNSWEKLDSYHPDWEKSESYPPVYRVKRSVTEKASQVAVSPATKPVAGRFSDHHSRISGQVTGKTAGQDQVSGTPKRSFEEGVHEEEKLSLRAPHGDARARADVVATAPPERVLGSKPTVGEIAGPGAVVAYEGQQQRATGHLQGCLCPVCRPSQPPSVPEQPTGLEGPWLDDLIAQWKGENT